MAQLKDDLRARAKASPAVTLALKTRHAAERADKRTADSFVAWQDHFIEQVAAAWMLSCVFVRTLEDRGLLGHNRIAGPGALDSQRVFLELAPSLNERDYLLFVFKELTRLPAAKDLFDARHNPVWLLAPSPRPRRPCCSSSSSPRADEPALRFGQATPAFWADLPRPRRERAQALCPAADARASWSRSSWTARSARHRQVWPGRHRHSSTPPAAAATSCLGAFERLYEQQLRSSPASVPREAARLALDKVYGADINPYAVAVARFRLTLAFLEKAGFSAWRRPRAPPLHVVVADSLLHNPHLAAGPADGDLDPSAPKTEWKGEGVRGWKTRPRRAR
jgi:hypothetical protein